MKTNIIQIGNSRGIRIPKVVLAQTKIEDEVELVVQFEQIIIRPARRPREGWAKAFRAMAERGDDQLLDEENLSNQSRWDEEEWEWEE